MISKREHFAICLLQSMIVSPLMKGPVVDADKLTQDAVRWADRLLHYLNDDRLRLEPRHEKSEA